MNGCIILYCEATIICYVRYYSWWCIFQVTGNISMLKWKIKCQERTLSYIEVERWLDFFPTVSSKAKTWGIQNSLVSSCFGMVFILPSWLWWWHLYLWWELVAEHIFFKSETCLNRVNFSTVWIYWKETTLYAFTC